MAERSNAHAWKACDGSNHPGVRIPLSPPVQRPQTCTAGLQLVLQTWNYRLPVPVFIRPQNACWCHLDFGVENRRVVQGFDKVFGQTHGGSFCMVKRRITWPTSAVVRASILSTLQASAVARSVFSFRLFL